MGLFTKHRCPEVSPIRVTYQVTINDQDMGTFSTELIARAAVIAWVRNHQNMVADIEIRVVVNGTVVYTEWAASRTRPQS